MDALRRLIDAIDFEITVADHLIHQRLYKDRGYLAIQQLPGVGPVLAAVLVAEIGDVHRLAQPEQLCSWAGASIFRGEAPYSGVYSFSSARPLTSRPVTL